MRSLVIGLEIGGTKLQAGLGTPEGEILAKERGRAPSTGGAQAILAWFDSAVPMLLERAAEFDGHVTGIGVGFGGPVESAAGRTVASFQVDGWDGIPLRDRFEERFQLPANVINDSNAAGWAEYRKGAGQGTRHFCYMNIGSGIGGALIVDGRLHDGCGFGAAEIGHTHVPDWTNSTPGASDKLENLCSGWSIEKRLRSAATKPNTPLWVLCEGEPERITCPMIAEAARQADAACLDELDRVARALGLALANVITLFHPERVALGGGVSLMGDVLLDPVRRHAADHVFGPYRDRYDIVPCALGESVVLVGALLLAPRG
jgi:glucokinase